MRIPASLLRPTSITPAFVCCIAIAAISFWIVFFSMDNMAFMERADESQYLHYAMSIDENGPAHFPQLFEDYISNEESHVFPSPFRAGYILLSTVFLKMVRQDYLSLAYLSLLSHTMLIMVVFLFARKHFGEGTGLLTAVLMAFSPLSMAMARRALPESTHYLFLAIAIWLFFDILQERSTSKAFAFTVFFSLAILMKESAVVLCPIFLVAYFVHRRMKGERSRPDPYALGAPVASLLFAGLVYIAISGNAGNLLRTAGIILTSPGTNQYAIQYGSGPWFRYIVDLLLVSPAPLILSAGFIFSRILSSRRDEEASYFIVVSLLIFLAMNFFTKNLRYVMILDMSIRLFSVLMLGGIFSKHFPRHRDAAVLCSVIFIAAYDLISFSELFVAGGIYDPVSFALLSVRRFIPF